MKAASIEEAARRFGSSRHPTDRNSIASAAIDSPTGVKSNIVKGLPNMSALTLAMMMLGEVPTSVTRPPTSEAAAIGISSEEGEVLWRRASWSAIGMKIASAPTFFVAIESSSTQPDSTGDLDGRRPQPRQDRAHQGPRSRPSGRCRR